MLGVGLRQLYRLIDIGELPGYQMGRLVRLRRAELDAFSLPERAVAGAKAVMAYLEEHRGAWVTPAEIRAALGCGAGLPSRAVAKLVAAGRAVEVDGRGSAVRYRLPGPT